MIPVDNTYKQGDAAYGSSGNKERGTVYQQEGGEPCYMSSSVYYGGREVYAKSSATQTSTSYPTVSSHAKEYIPFVITTTLE